MPFLQFLTHNVSSIELASRFLIRQLPSVFYLKPKETLVKAYAGPLNAQSILSLFNTVGEGSWDSVAEIPFYLNPLGLPGSALSFLGMVGKTIIEGVEYLSQYLPVWAIVFMAVLLFAIIMLLIVKSAVAADTTSEQEDSEEDNEGDNDEEDSEENDSEEKVPKKTTRKTTSPRKKTTKEPAVSKTPRKKKTSTTVVEEEPVEGTPRKRASARSASQRRTSPRKQ